MDRLGSLLFAVLLAGISPHSAGAHSWYPVECCSNQDCILADGMLTNHEGAKIVIVGDTRISIPHGLVARASPDGRIHVCFRTVAGDQFSGPEILPFCLFLPAEG
jgi:hypothetical protein